MGIRDKEQQRKSVVGSLISVTPIPEKKQSQLKESGKLQRAYYLAPEVVTALKIESAKTDISQSAIVECALKEYLGL